MNLICRLFGHSYRWCSGIAYCPICFHVLESHKRYMQIKQPKKKVYELDKGK